MWLLTSIAQCAIGAVGSLGGGGADGGVIGNLLLVDSDLGLAGDDWLSIFHATARRDGIGAYLVVVGRNDVPGRTWRDTDYFSNRAAGFAFTVQGARLGLLCCSDGLTGHGVPQK